MKRRYSLLTCFIISLQFSSIYAQRINFRRIDYKSEQPFSVFLDMSKDPLGYIWFSTYRNGIARYDGVEFVNFVHDDTNTNSLSNDHVGCIYADSSGIIWIGTSGSGLDRFDPFSNTFTHYRHEAKNEFSILNDTITAILEDHQGNLLLGTLGGLTVYNKKTGKCNGYQNNPEDSTSLSYNRIRTIYQDRSGQIWIGCGDPAAPVFNVSGSGGLNRFNPAKGNFTRYMHEADNTGSLESNVVGAIYEDSKGNFWVGTMGDGLHIMNRETGIFTHYRYNPEHPESLSRPPVYLPSIDYITFINEDGLGGIWIGTFFNGVSRFDTGAKKMAHFGIIRDSTHILKQDTSEGFLSVNVWCSMVSSDGLMWISTFDRELYSITVNNKTVPFFPITKNHGGANTFLYLGDSVLWIGSDSGLIRRNIKSQVERIYTVDPKNPDHRRIGEVTVLRLNKRADFLIGTYTGLLIFDPNSGNYTRFTHENKNASSLCNDSIVSLCVDHNQDVWIGTKNGLDKMTGKSGVFTHYHLEGPVNCLREDRNHDLWVGTERNLYYFHKGIMSRFLENARVISICVDSKNTIWIGADTGTNLQQTAMVLQILYHLDRGRNQFVKFRDPVSGNLITGIFDILEDSSQNLWISTTSAFFEINVNRTEVRKYGKSYGVLHCNFGTGDNLKAKDGRLFFGADVGYYTFFPDDLKSKSLPLVNFTGLKLNGKDIVPGGDILRLPLWETQEIKLDYNQNSFSIEYAGIDYLASGKVKFQVMLENYDNGWRENSFDKKSFYYNVAPGNYTFRVKAFNSDGGLSEKSILVIISPPWWKTWWAYILFVLAFIGTVSGYISYRSKKLKAENRLLEEKVNLRTNQLNQSIEELKSTQNQLVQSEKMASLGELTAGIAHEIQNPLNFVNNFSEVNSELIAELHDAAGKGDLEEIRALAKDIQENEQKIIHHGKRADAIVKGMLQHSRTSSGQKEPTDLNALADEYLRLSYHGLRAKDKFMNADMKTDFDPNLGNVNIIPQDIGRVLLNLYNNAFYAVTEKKNEQPEGFKPLIFVSTKKKGNLAEIRIKDNGRGIGKKILGKIFQPFFTTKPTGSGTGLGLSLSYDIIKAHGGELKVESTEGSGAEFIILLPLV